MSESTFMDEALAVSHPKKLEPRNPPEWQPHVELNGDTAKAVSKGMETANPDERELIEGWDLDPDEWMIVGDVQCRRWQTYDERWLRYFKANLRRIKGGVERADVDALIKMVDKRKPVKIPEATGSRRTFVISMNDWQCLAGDTVVFRRDGSACLLKDHEDAWLTGCKPTKRYVAEGGATVEATDNHPVFTRDRGWVNAGDLRVGDYVASLQEWDVWKGTSRIKKSYRFSERYSTIINVDVKVTEDLGALFGYLITDGTVKMKGQSVSFCSTTPEYLAEVEGIAQRELGCTTTRRRKSDDPDNVAYDVYFAGGNQHGGNPLHQLCKAMEWVDLFPIEVFDWPRGAVVKFVNRAFAADGCVTTVSGKPQIFLSGKNRKVYAHLWHALLLKFGITSTVFTQSMRKADGSPTTFYRVILGNGQSNVRRFFDTFGLICGKEEASQRALDFWDEHRAQNGRSKRIETFDEVDGEVMRWRRLIRIEDAGVQDVYDVTYEGKGWFIAQGMMVHNCGKGEGGGTPAMTEYLLAAFDRIGKRIKELRRVGRPVDEILLSNTGDLIEHVAGHYASQTFTVDLNLREQQRVVRHLIYRLIDIITPLAPRVVVTSAPCNHGSVRNGSGKPFTTPDDNTGHVIMESIEEALKVNPQRYGHVEFVYSPIYDLVVETSGVALGMAHGHMIRGSGASGAGVVNKWWGGQIVGNQPLAAAEVFLTAHRHHLEISEEIGRPLIMAPAADGGSIWYTTSTGRSSPRGVLTVCIGDTYERMWGDLAIL